MNQVLKISFATIAISVVLFGCKKDTPPKVDLGYNYYPAAIGSWLIYDVDSTVFDGFASDTIYYEFQIKEVLESTFMDDEGRESIRIERYKRDNTNAEWQIKDIWTTTVTENRVEVVEENVRYIKLTFPAKEGYTWNGNAFNDYEKEDYAYEDVDVSTTVGGISFDSALTVLHVNDSLPIIGQTKSLEKYARNVGMIYKEYIDMDFQTNDGLVHKLTINSYGKK